MKRMIHTNIEGMSRVGYTSGLEIYVNTDDGGNLPHFHMRDKTDWNKFHTCILIEQPKYFLHEGKENILNSKQRKELVEFMESQPSLTKYAGKFATNWELICFLWDMNNSAVNISDDATMPDYRQLKEDV